MNFANPPKKMLILNILDILKKYSDENHKLSAKDIGEILQREYSQTVDRKAIKRNLMNLIEFGYDIEFSETVRINKNGEVISSYYFKKLNSSTISEKVTYARLYKDFDWIIAMGVHLDDIEAYTEKTKLEINALSSETALRLVAYTFVVFIIGFTILYIMEKNFILTSTNSYEKQINLDLLTNAYSRRYGEKNLNNFYKHYRSNGEKPAIMMLDIDDFKHINDKYGHAVGDLVLIEVVKVVNHIVRSSDKLIRWGGDEFIGVFPGLREENIIEFGKKILNGISLIEIKTETGNIGVTISIGFSYFNESDNSYDDVLKRADAAMYLSKKQGKNRANILL